MITVFDKNGRVKAKKVTAILAVVTDNTFKNERYIIGLKRADGSFDLAWKNNKEDMKFFKKTTENNTVIMGNNTFDSIGRKPLINRTNIVCSTKPIAHKPFDTDTASLYNINPSIISDLSSMADKPFFDERGELFVIGGAKIYSTFAHVIDEILVTFIPKKELTELKDGEEYVFLDDYFTNLIDNDSPHQHKIAYGSLEIERIIVNNFDSRIKAINVAIMGELYSKVIGFSEYKNTGIRNIISNILVKNNVVNIPQFLTSDQLKMFVNDELLNEDSDALKSLFPALVSFEETDILNSLKSMFNFIKTPMVLNIVMDIIDFEKSGDKHNLMSFYGSLNQISNRVCLNNLDKINLIKFISTFRVKCLEYFGFDVQYEYDLYLGKNDLILITDTSQEIINTAMVNLADFLTDNTVKNFISSISEELDLFNELTAKLCKNDSENSILVTEFMSKYNSLLIRMDENLTDLERESDLIKSIFGSVTVFEMYYRLVIAIGNISEENERINKFLYEFHKHINTQNDSL